MSRFLFIETRGHYHYHVEHMDPGSSSHFGLLLDPSMFLAGKFGLQACSNRSTANSKLIYPRLIEQRQIGPLAPLS